MIIYFFFHLKKNIKTKDKLLNVLLSGIIFLIILMPHLFWLSQNDFSTISYGFKRTGGVGDLTDHLAYPILFFLKQLGILIPFFIMGFCLINKFTMKINLQDKKILFLNFTVTVPIILMIITSIIMGAKIRTMWMTPFYLAFGTLFLMLFKKQVNLKKLKKFYLVFLFIFSFSPFAYLTISLLDDTKRTDYPGKEISRLVQNKWNDNFVNDIKIVIGDEWSAGNLSYHLKSRPVWVNDLKKKGLTITDDQGVIYTGNPKILKKVCPGVFGSIKPVGYCMIGKR